MPYVLSSTPPFYDYWLLEIFYTESTACQDHSVISSIVDNHFKLLKVTNIDE